MTPIKDAQKFYTVSLQEFQKYALKNQKKVIEEYAGKEFLFVAKFWRVNGRHDIEGLQNYVAIHWPKIMRLRTIKARSTIMRQILSNMTQEHIDNQINHCISLCKNTLSYLDKNSEYFL